MATIKKDFADYLKANKSRLNKDKFSRLKDQSKVDTLYNEWKTTKELPKSYLKPIKGGIKKVTPTKNNTPTKVEPTPTKADPIKDYAESSTLGQISESNVGIANKIESTTDAFERKQKEAAKESEEVLRKAGDEQSQIIKESNEGARGRYDKQQEQLDKNKERAITASEERRRQASEILNRQEGIASRQANIAAAKAGQGGIEVSEAQMQDMKDNIIAKYGQNIASAEQFAAQTNMTLDTALTQLDSFIFKDKQAIDNFVNKLDESERAPILSAVAEAAKGNVQAISDAKDLINTIITKKVTEETIRLMKPERLEDNQRRWVGLNQRQKGDLLSDDFGKENKWVMDPYRNNPDKYKTMSYGEALDTLTKIKKNVELLNDSENIKQYITNKANAESEGKPFTKEAAFEEILNEAYTAVDQMNATAEKKTEQRGDTGSTTTKLTEKYDKEKTKPTGISDKNIAVLDKALSLSNKDKVLEILKKGLKIKKYSQDVYDRYVKYINSK